MGPRRAESSEYKIYLAQLSQDFHGIYKAAVNGHYEGSCFVNDNDTNYNLTGPASMRRFRAVVQQLNINFAETHRISGHKYDIDLSCTAVFGDSNDTSSRKRTHDQMTDTDLSSPPKYIPSRMSRTKALAWVKQVLVRTRGKELIGNFNPLLVGELYWEQSSRWGNLAMEHLDKIAQTCDRFLNLLLKDKCPTDVAGRLRIAIFQNSLKARRDNAVEELSKIMEDERSYPINYNHYYTDNIAKARTDRQKRILSSAITNATTQKRTPMFGIGGPDQIAPAVDINQVVANFNGGIDPDMENVSCEEALDCLSAIYKVSNLSPLHILPCPFPHNIQTRHVTFHSASP